MQTATFITAYIACTALAVYLGMVGYLLTKRWLTAKPNEPQAHIPAQVQKPPSEPEPMSDYIAATTTAQPSPPPPKAVKAWLYGETKRGDTD